MAIHTPDQRVRVFVSSTMQELAPERGAVREAIEGLHLTPVMFELGARPYPPRALYRAYLEQSDIFIGLYWESYGWVPPGEELSGLEDEYRLSGDRPKLIYIKAPATNRQSRLTEMIARIQQDNVSYRPFSTADELPTLVADDLAVLLTERFAATEAPEAPVGPPRPAPVQTLPRPVTRLIGRDTDIALVLDLLANPDVRMVTIVGPGGIGKSRLALAVAEGAKERYPDGVVYVDLASLCEPSLVLPTIAKSLGIEEPGTSADARLRDRLADARMLIVLDNMEQLADAVGDLSDLLGSTEAVQLLVTSRRLLDVRAERVYALGPLAVPADAAVTAAVELFLDRARSIHAGYQPSAEDLATFAELARRLDGLPLAIELAAAWLRVLSARALLKRMGQQALELLREGPRDLPARQRTLRDTIAWSHSLLSADARLLFARLAVFVGSADLESIEQVTNPDGRLDTLGLIAELVDQSLVQALGEAAEPRFGMLETIREFADEQLEASDTAADYRAAHQAYYLQLAERGNAALGTAEQVEWLNRLGRENDNFRAVLRRALQREDANSALRMGRALAIYWDISSRYAEGRGWMEQTASLPSAQPYERAVAQTIAAIEAFMQGDFEAIETGLDDAFRIAAEGEDRRLAAFAQLLQVMAKGSGPDGGQWQDAVTEASRRLEAEGEPLAVGFGLVAGALLARTHGRLDEARRLAQQAHDLSVQMGESFVRGYASTQLARACLGLGDMVAARNSAVEALLVARSVRNVVAMSYALELWATVELSDGRVERAGQLYALADHGYRQVGYQMWRTDAEEHSQFDTELRAALGDQYEQVLARARNTDFDRAVGELIESDPAAQRSSDGTAGYLPPQD